MARAWTTVTFGLSLAVACATSPAPEAPPTAAQAAASKPAEVTVAPPAPDASPEPSTEDASAPHSDPFGLRDAAVEDASPPVLVRGAVARQAGNNRWDIVLLGVAPSTQLCGVRDGDPELVMTLGCGWSAGNRCAAMTLKLASGKVTRRHARVLVVDAPQTRGQTGRIRLEHTESTNVHGGEVPVLVCN